MYKSDLYVAPVISNDTFMNSYTDSLNNWHTVYFPVNTSILYKSNQESAEIYNCSIIAINDTTKYSFNLFSTGLQIYLTLTFLNNKYYNGKITYWWNLLGQVFHFDILNCKLILNKKTFKKGDNLMGNISLDFKGYGPEKLTLKTLKTIEIKGKIEGDFNITVE